MNYFPEDLLLFKGFSENYKRVIITKLDDDLDIIFNFIPCIDGDNNNYPVVSIDQQTWMFENLKTTTFSNGNNIPHITAEIELNITEPNCDENGSASISNYDNELTYTFVPDDGIYADEPGNILDFTFETLYKIVAKNEHIDPTFFNLIILTPEVNDFI
ncbi:MAG: hypothetical protein ACP5DZ_06535 [Bacteroidales bacterium]